MELLKSKLGKVLITPLVAYVSERWKSAQADQEKIAEENNENLWAHVINEILNGEDLVKFVKPWRLRSFGRVQRMDESRMD